MGLRGILSRTALLCGFVIGLAELLVIFSRTSWIGFLGYTPEWANAGLYVVSPLVAGVAAFVARGYFTPEVVSITGTRSVVGALRAVISAGSRILLVALGVHFAAIAVAATVTVAFGSSGALRWEPFVLGMTPLAMACAIGVTLSAIFPHPWSAVLALLVTYAVWYLAVTTSSALPVNIGGATISLAGLRYRPDAVLASVLAAGFVTAVFLTIAAATIRLQHFAWGMTIFTVGTVCILVAGTAVGSRMPVDRFGAAVSTEFICEGSAPRVCLTSDHSARAEEVAKAIETAGRVLAAVGVDLTDVTLREGLADEGPDADGVVLLSFGQLNGIGTSPLDYARALLRPTDCADYYAPQPTAEGERLLETAHTLSAWMEAKIAGADPAMSDGQVRGLYEGLQACSVSEDALTHIRTP